MTWLNRYEVEDYIRRAQHHHYPIAEKACLILNELVRWTDSHSDGWSSWPKPGRAAAKLMDALYYRFGSAWDKRIQRDLTEAELRTLLTPIRSFLTRHNVDAQWRTRILEAQR